MSCGRDPSYLKELRSRLSIHEDLISIYEITKTLLEIRVDMYKIFNQSFITERLKLREKINLYLQISSVVLNSLGRNLEVPTKLDKTKKAIKMIRELNKMCREVKKTLEEFNGKLDQLNKLVKETEEKWNVKVPDKDVITKMSKKERKELIKLWREREKIAVQGRAEFEDLKAEWDSAKEGLDLNIMTCLWGIARLKE